MQKLTPHVSLHQSRLWQTNTGIVQGPQGTLLIDPGIYPEEMDAIAAASSEVFAGFSTHAHWDHVLWQAGFGIDVPRYASTETVALLNSDSNRIRKSLADAERAFGLTDSWDDSLLFTEQPMPWGRGSIASIACELMPVPGHADGQAALLLPEHGVAFVADTLSDIEIPSVDGGSRGVAIYLQTLDRLQTVIDRVEWIVPGHGSPANQGEAQRRLDADRRYLEALGPAVCQAREGEGAEEIAARVLHELDEHRAASELASAMHLENIQALVEERDLLASGPPVRRSSRIILLDADSRVWLFRINDPVRPRWILPGGGVEEGESWEDTARRELWEECGIDDVRLSPVVATREALGRIAGIPTLAQERYFVARLNGQLPHIGNMLPYEFQDYTAQRWFSADDIRASYDQVYPIGLADLLDVLRDGEYPAEPWTWLD